VVPALPVTRVMRPVKRHVAWSAGCPLFAGEWRECLVTASCLFGLSTHARGGPACTAISRKAAEGRPCPRFHPWPRLPCPWWRPAASSMACVQPIARGKGVPCG